MELRKRMRHGDVLVVTIGGERLSITFLDDRQSSSQLVLYSDAPLSAGKMHSRSTRRDDIEVAGQR